MASHGAVACHWSEQRSDVWFVSFFSNEVIWRGYRARISKKTEMIELAV